MLALGVLIFLMLQLPSSEAGEPQMTASYVNYDDFNCSDCHGSKWTGWAATKHASAWVTLMSSGSARELCEDCHATGGGKPSIFPATGYDNATNSPTYLQNVTCQPCHGPASNHEASPGKSTIALVMNSSLCGSCHYASSITSEHHPTYTEWQLSGHNTSLRLPDYVKQPSCSNCHEAWNAMEYLMTGVEKTVLREVNEDAPISWEIACATCHDPHSTGVAGTQLRVPPEEICARCHNSEGAQPPSEPHHPMAEMRDNTAGYGIDRTGLDYMSDVSCVSCHMADNNAGLPNHTFVPNPYACVVCHPGTFLDNESARGYIDAITAMTNAGIGGAEPLLEEANALIEQMRGNRTSEDLVYWDDEYDIALFNLETVISDNSEGNHNPALAGVLLGDAVTRGELIVANLDPPDKITGVKATRLADGTVTVEWDASLASDFAKYRIYVLTTKKTNITSDVWTVELTSQSTVTYNLTDITQDAVVYIYVTAVDADGNEITNTVKAATISGDLESIIDQLEQTVADLEDEVDDLQSQNDQLGDQVSDLRDDVASLESQRTTFAIVMLAIGIIVGVLVGMMLARKKKPEGVEPEKPALEGPAP